MLDVAVKHLAHVDIRVLQVRRSNRLLRWIRVPK